MKKLAAVLLTTLLLITAFVVTASAHSGRTDENGGHYDYSTGEYHYHDGKNAGKSNDSSSRDLSDSEYNRRLNVIAEVSGASDGAKQKERDIIYTSYFIKSYNDKLTSFLKNHIVFDYLYSKNQLSDFQLSSYSVPYDKYKSDRQEWRSSLSSGYIIYNDAYDSAYNSTNTVNESYYGTSDFYDQVACGTVDGTSYFNNRISVYQEAFPVKFFFILLTTCQLVVLPLLIASILLTILFFVKFNFYSKLQNYSIKKQCIIAALYSVWLSALLLIFVYPYLEFPKFEGRYEWSFIDVLHLIICLFSVFAFLRIHLVKKENGKYILRSNEEHEITVNNSVTIIESISLATLLFLLSFYVNFHSEIATIEYVLIVFAIPIVLPFLYAILIYGACLAIKLLFYCVVALISKIIDFSYFIKDVLPSRKAESSETHKPQTPVQKMTPNPKTRPAKAIVPVRLTLELSDIKLLPKYAESLIYPIGEEPEDVFRARYAGVPISSFIKLPYAVHHIDKDGNIEFSTSEKDFDDYTIYIAEHGSVLHRDKWCSNSYYSKTYFYLTLPPKYKNYPRCKRCFSYVPGILLNDEWFSDYKKILFRKFEYGIDGIPPLNETTKKLFSKEEKDILYNKRTKKKTASKVPPAISSKSSLTISKMMHELVTENVKPYKMCRIGKDISAGTLYFAPADESIRSFFESGDEICHISQKNQRFFFTDGEIIYLYNCDVSTEAFK